MSFFSRFLKPSSPTTLSPEAFVAQRDPAAPLLDVRTPAEYASGHLAGAVNVDVMASDFRARVDALKLPTDAPVYLYCRSGSRSSKATRLLHGMGFTQARNVGGYDALRAAGARVGK